MYKLYLFVPTFTTITPKWRFSTTSFNLTKKKSSSLFPSLQRWGWVPIWPSIHLKTCQFLLFNPGQPISRLSKRSKAKKEIKLIWFKEAFVKKNIHSPHSWRLLEFIICITMATLCGDLIFDNVHFEPSTHHIALTQPRVDRFLTSKYSAQEVVVGCTKYMNFHQTPHNYWNHKLFYKLNT